MFWGLIMEPNKRYTQVVENPFHISQAALDISTGDGEACQVMVLVDGKNFLVCTLQKNKIIQVPLDLYFKTGDSISFLTNGKCNVHLTGYLDPEYEDDVDDEEEDDDEEEEAPELVPAKNKRKLENSNDSASKKPKQDKKAKKAVAEDSDDSDDDDEDQLQKLLDGEDVDSDENDESFKINTSAEADSDEDSDENDEDEEEAEGEESDSDSEEVSQAETTLDTSKEEKDIDMSKLSKAQRRRLKKKLQQQQKQQPQVNGIDKKEKKQDGQQNKKKQDGKKENEQPAVEKKEKKTISGGVAIEDLKVGNGPIAKPGKVVQVYYEGRLKTNNKMFDNCTKGPGFKFRLGSKEVISGWDVGVSGMKVGGKRRIVCPPAMAYGAKGSPPVIPPNSTLVFEVELKNVK